MSAAPVNGARTGVVEFLPNVPVELAMKYPAPKMMETRYGMRAMFSTTDGRVFFLDPEVAQKITLLGIRPNERFSVCMRQVQDGRERRKEWDVWLSSQSEKQRAQEEAPQLERQLRESITAVNEKKYPARPTPIHSPAQDLAHSGWAAQIRERTEANLEIYWQLCQWAQERFPGMTKREVSSFLMNALISGEKGGKR